MKFCSNLSVVRANSNWRLGFQFGTGISEALIVLSEDWAYLKFRTVGWSDICRRCGFWKCYGIDLGCWWKACRFLWKFVNTNYWGPKWCLGPLLARINQNCLEQSCIWDRATKETYIYIFFFVSDKADWYFMNYTLEWGFEVFVEEDIRKQGVGKLDN